MALNIIDLSTVPADAENFTSFLDQLCNQLDLDFASYAMVDPFHGSVHGYANYPDTWKQHYMQRGFQNIDPILHKASRSIAPVDWTRFERDDLFAKVFHEAVDFGITPQGLTVPIRGPFGEQGLLSVTRNCKQGEWEKVRRHMIGDLQHAAVHLHDSVMSSSTLARLLLRPQLSEREREILQWVAAGKQQQDIACILAISDRTVEVHLRSIRTKLGALTTPQAVGRAIGYGFISPQ
ncbi:MAG: LuxR family transcriptional regulator [Paracoccaceae bacterium]|nr:LuxR family transcriptional regulator [Paracoccaceae bacterium]